MLSVRQERAPGGVFGDLDAAFCIWPGHRRGEQKNEGIDWSSAPTGGISIVVAARDLYRMDNCLARNLTRVGLVWSPRRKSPVHDQGMAHNKAPDDRESCPAHRQRENKRGENAQFSSRAGRGGIDPG
jgi:hypothetical protein